jgi:vancomycin permeability regulator SanA
MATLGLSLVILLVVHFLFIAIYGLSMSASTAEVAIVLGSKIELDGQPSRRLKERLKVGLRLYQTGKVENIIVSGGIGKEGFDESRVMADYLIVQGVNPRNIVRDSLGITTFASAINCKAIMNQNQWDSVVVVSQYFHLLRSKIALQRAGISHVEAEGTKTYFEWRDFYSIFREIPGMYYYLLREYP